MAGNGRHKHPIDAPRTDIYWCDPNELILIGRDTPDGQEHPLWDTRSFLDLEEEFVVNILRYGVLVSVTARSLDGQLQVVDGRRRVLHAREALARQVQQGTPETELLRVPVRIVRGGDEAHLISMARLANSFRREETILEKAHHAQRMLGFGRTEHDVAVNYGVDETTVHSWLSLLEANQSLRKAVIDGQVAPSAAYRLARLPNADQPAAVAELVSSGRTSIREARRVTAKTRGHGDTVGAPRRTLRGIRELLRADEGGDDFQRGVAAALDLVLGTETAALDERIRHWTEAVKQRPKTKTKELPS